MINQHLDNMLIRYNLHLVILGNISKSQITIIGDKKYTETMLYKTLFDISNPVENLNNYLDGKILPQLFKQSDLMFILCKPNKDYVAAILYEETRKPIESYTFSIIINEKLCDIFKNL